MQRDIFDKKTLTLFFLYLLILLYPAAETVYPFLPPMLGLAYVQWRSAVRAKNLPLIAAWMLYALIFESVWGLPLYGIWSMMIVTFVLFDYKITQTLHMQTVIKVLSAVIFDLLYFVFLYGYGVLMSEKLIDTSAVLFYYFAADILGVVLL
ncbi:hypothetical protein [Hydrogenimonas sp.]